MRRLLVIYMSKRFFLFSFLLITPIFSVSSYAEEVQEKTYEKIDVKETSTEKKAKCGGKRYDINTGEEIESSVGCKRVYLEPIYIDYDEYVADYRRHKAKGHVSKSTVINNNIYISNSPKINVEASKYEASVKEAIKEVAVEPKQIKVIPKEMPAVNPKPVAKKVVTKKAKKRVIIVASSRARSDKYNIAGYFCDIINKHNPKFLCLNKPTTSVAEDINHINRYDFIISQSPVSAMYQNKYDKYVRSVMNLYEESGNFIVNTKSGIKSFKDLEGKKVYFGVKGSSAYNTFEDLVKVYNIDISKIVQSSKSSPYYMEDLCHGKIDAVFMDFAHPNPVLANAIKNCKIKILPLGDEKVQHLIDHHHHYIKSLIPYNDYNLSSDVYTIGHTVSILTKTHMDKDVVYEVTKTIFDNFQEFKSRDILLTRMLKHEMVDRKNGLVFKQHDGAMKYYNEMCKNGDKQVCNVI